MGSWSPRRAQARRRENGVVRRVAQTGGLLILAHLLLLAAGCGSAQPPSTEAAAVGSPKTSTVATATLPAPATTAAAEETVPPYASSTSSETWGTDARIQAAFIATATALDPVLVYAPTALPPGAELAESWRPVMGAEQNAPPDSGPAGPPVSNPRLRLEGSEPQAEVLVEVPGGGLLFLDNFRGDLGDVTGEAVGDVAGRPAFQHELAGGTLVQWSDTGRWYAVYGWGEGAEHVVPVTQEMRVLRP